jgi:hypothetical protein
MSVLLANAKGASTAITPQRNLIVSHPLNNIQQWSKGVSAAPKSVEPSTTTVIDVKFNSNKWEQELNQYFEYNVKNASATSAITFKNGALNHFHKIKLTPNNTENPIVIESLAQVRAIVSNFYLKRYGLDIYEGTSFVRNEFTTFNGITVPALSSVKFYYDLAPYLDWSKTTIRGAFSSLRIELEATPEPSNFLTASKYFLSSTTSAVYTNDNITFENINYVRQFAIIQNPNLLVGFLNADKPVRKIHWKVYEYVKYTGSFRASQGDSYNCKLSDIRKAHGIQWFCVDACRSFAQKRSFYFTFASLL